MRFLAQKAARKRASIAGFVLKITAHQGVFLKVSPSSAYWPQ
ncbi:hypothetical protein [Undibacterium sp. Jales W-56]|nr:hypothetical protein [Undibacterium sp. Jales W-56]